MKHKKLLAGWMALMILTLSACGGNVTDSGTVRDPSPTAGEETQNPEETPQRTPRPIAEPTKIEMPPVDWRIAELTYDRGEIQVIGADIRDYNVEPDSGEDVTTAAQAALNVLGLSGGGTLFFPEGHYSFSGKLVIPEGVTILGDWKEPDGKGTVGTVFEVLYGRNGEKGDPFVTVHPNAAVRCITFWYPEQDPNEITPYATTVKLLDPQVWGAHSTYVKDCTFINSYIAVRQGPQGNDLPNVTNIYGTPLYLGLDVDGISDVGRFDFVYFSPDYWAKSGLPGAPEEGTKDYEALKSHLRQNATGVAFGRVDWSYFTYIEVTGYAVGLHLRSQIDDKTNQPVQNGNYPNGHVYRHSYRDCAVGILIDGVNYAGEAFTEVTIGDDCDVGIYVTRNDEHKPQSGHMQFYNCVIGGKDKALQNDGYGRVVMLECELRQASASTNGNVLFTNCTFNTAGAALATQDIAQAAFFLGCEFSSGSAADNQNATSVLVDDTKIPLEPVRDTPLYAPEPKKAAKAQLTVVDTDNTGASDTSAAIQDALDKAGENGGGIVFLPPGEYRLDKGLLVPGGVELRGAVDVGRMPLNLGTIFKVYYGKGSSEGDAAVSLQEKGGLRGVVFDYPEQEYDNMQPYPYSVRTLGADCYLVNVSFRNSYDGLDMMTYRSDRHYVESLIGFCLHNTLKIGGGSTGGKVFNYQMNMIIVNNGGESKFGSWVNSIDNDETKGQALLKWVQENGVAMILGHVEDQFLFNNFSIFGNEGVRFVLEDGKGASGWCVGQGVDYTTKCLVFEGLGDMQFINTQLVSFKQDFIETDVLTQIMTKEGFTGKAVFYNVAFWGAAGNTLCLYGGDFYMYNAVVANVPRLIADTSMDMSAHLVNFCVENDNNASLAAEGVDMRADMLFSKGGLQDAGAKGIFHTRKGYAGN